MKKKFRVELFYETEYPEIEAETEEEAFRQALEMWDECIPNVVIRPAEKEEEEYPELIFDPEEEEKDD